MSAFPIVDSHVHLWNPALFRYPWLDALATLNHAFLPSDLAAATGTHVDKFIFVECGCLPEQSLAEVDWISSLAKNEPRLKGIVAHAAVEKGKAIQMDLEALAARPLVKGVRRSLQDQDGVDQFLRPEFVAGVALLAKFGFTFDLCLRHEQLRGAAELARRVPNVLFVLDHFGKPGVRAGKTEPWACDLKAFAALPNTVCKISGLTTEADWKNWRPAHLKFYFDWALECFGPDRVLFGGDWPVATLATSYQGWLNAVWEFSSPCSDAERTKLCRTNAERIYHV